MEVKSRWKYQERAMPSLREDFNISDDSLRLDEYRICYIKDSHCIQKLVTRGETLCLKSDSLHINNDINIDEFNKDLHCMEENDLTIYICA